MFENIFEKVLNYEPYVEECTVLYKGTYIDSSRAVVV